MRVAGGHICGHYSAAGLRAVFGADGQHHHRHDSGQHVWRHVAVGHQPQRGVSSEPGYGERKQKFNNFSKGPQ